MKLAVVTPVLNPHFNYFCRLISQIIYQKPHDDLEVYYHIQDRSNNNNVEKFLNFFDLSKYRISYERKNDKSLYDGVNYGFKNILKKIEPDLMYYINHDDFIFDETFLNFYKSYKNNQEYDWFITNSIEINNNNEIIKWDNQYASYKISLGLNDGKKHPPFNDYFPFVTQESVFWTYKLWKKVGEFNENLKLAGDYEYWIRCAQAGFEIKKIDANCGAWQRREGQLGSDVFSYMLECESSKKELCKESIANFNYIEKSKSLIL